MKIQKYCQNSECGLEIIIYKSSKRIYCNDSCKNRANYLKRTLEEAYLIEMDKAMRKNYKILIKLKRLNLGPINEQTLISHGFDFDAIHKAEIKIDNQGNKVQLYHIYDRYFYNQNNQIIIVN